MKFHAIFLALLLPLVSCGSGDKNEPVVTPTSITLDKTNIVLAPRHITTLTATVIPYNTATWTSNNPEVVTVNAAGQLTAVSKGTCDIIVTAKEGRAECKVIVPGGSPDFNWLAVGEDQGQAVIWTDKGAHNLGSGVAKSISKSNDGTLFVAGESNDIPVIWVGNNFEKQPLSNAKGKANFSYISNNDLYIAGQTNQQAVYWKNGGEVVLSSPSSGHVLLNSEATSITITPEGVYVVGSGEFSRLLDYVPETGKIQTAQRWLPGITYALTTYASMPNGEVVETIMYKIRSINDGSIISLYNYYDIHKTNRYTTLKSVRGDNLSGVEARIDYNRDDIWGYDLTPYGDFKTVASRDNTVLVATNIGVYKVTQVPNKAYVQLYGGFDTSLFQSTLLPGYGYSRVVRLLGNDIYAAGKNIIYKNGAILNTLSPTAEIYSLLVQ